MGIRFSRKCQYNTGETVPCRYSKFASRRHNGKVQLQHEGVVDDIPNEIEVTLAGKTFVLKESGWMHGNYLQCH